MIAIYANILCYALYICGLVGAAIERYHEEYFSGASDVKFNYDVVGLFISMLMVITIIGLFKRKAWAYQMALGINAAITLIPVFYIAGVSIMLWEEISLMEIITISKVDLYVSVVFFIFWVILYKSGKTKKAYNKLIQRDFQKCRAFCKKRKSPANFESP